jgi:hypothetical protein
MEISPFDDGVYFSLAYVRDTIDPFLFWDESAQALFMSTADSITRFGPDNDVRLHEGIPWISEAFIAENYPLPEPVLPPVQPSGGINMVWELITVPAANGHAMANPLPEGLNVISPTWFYFCPVALDGTLISHASYEYVQWAKAQGVAVWPRLFDSNFELSNVILNHWQHRERAVAQLIAFIENYNLDGINVNFEHIRLSDGGYYVQFLRELAVEMRRIHSVISVATYVPAPWHFQYHHRLVGKTVDYMVVMTYDEHVPSSETPGPIASLPFVERWIATLLTMVPRERICDPYRYALGDGSYAPVF